MLTNKLIPKPRVEIPKITAPIEMSLTKDPGSSPSFLGAPPKNPAEINRGEINKPILRNQTAKS